MMNFLMSMMMMMSLILLSLNHPLSMGLILIIQTLITSMVIGYMLSSFFFSYIIIMTMLSGALVLFIYMASIASNEKFKSPLFMMLISLSFMLITYTIMYLYNFNYFNNMIINNEIISLIKMYNMITAQLTMMMIMYLLYTMIVVSNIVNINKGPLRMKI
nr:TPA_asm: NADH dehydrogenase subunit 6 [Stiretrus anchorago]